jgi:hypothetical protein
LLPKTETTYHTTSELTVNTLLMNDQKVRQIPENQVDNTAENTVSYHNMFTRTVLGMTQTLTTKQGFP